MQAFKLYSYSRRFFCLEHWTQKLLKWKICLMESKNFVYMIKEDTQMINT